MDYEAHARRVLKECGGSIKLRLSDTKPAPWNDDDPRYRPHYRVTLRGPGGVHVLDFWNSINAGETGEEATAYDVLSCLEWFDQGTFESFCGEFGYDTDSIRAEQCYRSVKAQAAALTRIFPDEQSRQKLAEIR